MIKYKSGKRYKDAAAKIVKKQYSVSAAIELAKQTATAKFNESIDIAVGLNLDPRHADQNIRKVVSLPAGTGKDVKVACIVTEDLLEDAKNSGADIYGGEEIIEEIKKGNINFDRCVANPAMMPKLGAVARILGPKGLMPNPKLGTVTKDVKSAVMACKAGQVEIKLDKNGIVHTTIGKSSFDAVKLQENFATIIAQLDESKPKVVKGKYYKNLTISSSMGPSIVIDLKDLSNLS